MSQTNLIRSARHPDAHPTDIFAQWVTSRFQSLSMYGSPLIVPITATFKPGSIRQDKVLGEFERFYHLLCSLLVNNCHRPSKRHLKPFAIAWRDDPRTRPDKYRARPAWHAAFFSHPSVVPHVHGVMVIHPQLVDRFRAVVGELRGVWQGMSSSLGAARDVAVLRNRTLKIDLDSGERWLSGFLGDTPARSTARDELQRWLAYSAKLGERRDVEDGDLFTVLPTERYDRKRRTIRAMASQL
jgi:hypothetical protein